MKTYTGEEEVAAWVCRLCDHPPIRLGAAMMEHTEQVHGVDPGDCQNYEIRMVPLNTCIYS